MNNIKQSPFLGLTGMGGGGTGLALGGAVAKKTYLDDLFSTYVYTGNSSTKTINNGIDLDGEGGLTWVKSRSSASTNHMLWDTVNNKRLNSNDNVIAESAPAYNFSFTSTGFTQNNPYTNMNQNGVDYSSWSFRKSPGFFDVVSWTTSSDGSSQRISHNLGCIPGLILVKSLNQTADWTVFHRDSGKSKMLKLNSDAGMSTSNGLWTNSNPTSTDFGWNGQVYNNNEAMIAYVFAGGESDATGARSVDFDGSSGYLSLAGSTDLNLTGDFTIEFWVYPRSQSTSRQSIIQTGSWGSQYAVVQIQNDTQTGLDKKAQLWDYDMNQSMPIIYSNTDIEEDQWTHVAFTRESGTIKVFINGNLDKTATGLSDSIDFGHTTTLIGKHAGGTAYYLNARLSNLRIVKGTAVYTSSFRPPYEPLTNITNTTFLGCNSASETDATVTPGTITRTGNAFEKSASPFDDPAGFVFGDGMDQNVIKTSSYVGNGSATGPDVFLGFEPSWVMLKNITGSGKWMMADNMRGVVTGGDDPYLDASDSAAEYTTYNWIEFTSTGFTLKNTGSSLNTDGSTYVYICIRRSDGYVGKIPELGTNVFATDTGSGTSGIPSWDSNFVVDMAMNTQPASTGDKFIGARLIGTNGLETNSTATSTAYSNWTWDSMSGWNKGSANSSWQSWMFKRNKGMDVVNYNGSTASSLDLQHSLNAVPEMMWIKCKSEAEDWRVYHKGLNGGTNPQDYYLRLNTTAAESNAASTWNDTAPTSTHFTVGNDGAVNNNNRTYIAMLFASVDNISKVGSWIGNGTNNRQITLGFQPRLLLVFLANQGAGYDWQMIDSLRGFLGGGSNDQCKILRLNTTADQFDAPTYFTPNSTGFTITESAFNGGSQNWLYYAHA